MPSAGRKIVWHNSPDSLNNACRSQFAVISGKHCSYIGKLSQLLDSFRAQRNWELLGSIFGDSTVLAGEYLQGLAWPGTGGHTESTGGQGLLYSGDNTDGIEGIDVAHV